MAKFSVTELGTFRRCRRQWDWSSKSRQNLTAIGSGPEPLELGGLVHRALADFVVMSEKDQQKQGSLAASFLVHANKRKEEVSEQYTRVTKKPVPPTHLESLLNVITLGTAMMINYQNYWKTAVPKNMRFAVPEQEVMIPVPGTEYQCPKCLQLIDSVVTENTFQWAKLGDKLFKASSSCEECSGLGYLRHHLTATLDGLLQDVKDRFYVLEHKTYENRPDPISLYMNDQFTGYCWVVRELNVGRVVGVAYDGMWKRDKPPKYMQKEKRPGTLDDLFIRKIIEKHNEELDEWGSNLAKTINDMANDPAIYPNVPWQGCSDCSFREICHMTMRGEATEESFRLRYTQREEIVRGGKS